MNKGARILVIVGLSAVGVLGAAWSYQSYAQKSKDLDGDIERFKQGLADRDLKMQDKAKVSRELKKVASTTLGTDEEKVTASLRKALNEVAAHYRLTDTSVTSARASGVKNPAAQQGVREIVEKATKEQRNAPDFFAVPATLVGKGTLEQVARTMATLESQPWVHKIDSFSIKPVGKERDRVELSVSLSTIYLTGDAAKGVTTAENVNWSPVTEDQFASWRPIVMKNVFREPPPEKAVAAAPSPAAATPAVASATPPPPPPPPYEDWRISGITTGVKGAELMVVNDKTKEWRTLTAGAQVLDVKFVEAVGDVARILVGDKQYEIRTGQRLSERALVTR